MINIRDKNFEKMIDEILKRTHYSSPSEYIGDRVKKDHSMVMRKKDWIEINDYVQGLQE